MAVQRGEQIFHMSASFQIAENANDRQVAIPQVPEPESLPDMLAVVEDLKRRAPDRRPLYARRNAFEFRPAELPDPTKELTGQPQMKIWLRAVDALPDDPILHRCLLAYVSDYYLLTVATMDARLQANRSGLRMASIDHAMWFHRPARADEWLLYVMDSPTSCGSRGLARGSIFSRDGRLVASTAQEGLIRWKSNPPSG